MMVADNGVVSGDGGPCRQVQLAGRSQRDRAIPRRQAWRRDDATKRGVWSGIVRIVINAQLICGNSRISRWSAFKTIGLDQSRGREVELRMRGPLASCQNAGRATIPARNAFSIALTITRAVSGWRRWRWTPPTQATFPLWQAARRAGAIPTWHCFANSLLLMASHQPACWNPACGKGYCSGNDFFQPGGSDAKPAILIASVERRRPILSPK